MISPVDEKVDFFDDCDEDMLFAALAPRGFTRPESDLFLHTGRKAFAVVGNQWSWKGYGEFFGLLRDLCHTACVVAGTQPHEFFDHCVSSACWNAADMLRPADADQERQLANLMAEVLKDVVAAGVTPERAMRVFDGVAVSFGSIAQDFAV